MLPFDLLTTFEHILLRIKDIGNKQLSANNIKHTLDTLFAPHIYNLYYDVNNKKTIGDMSDELMDYIVKSKFILQIDNDTFWPVEEETILCQYDHNYYKNDDSYFITKLLDDTSLILQRIATYYPSIKTYETLGNDLIFCPNDKPYLSYQRRQEINKPDNIKYAMCQNLPDLVDEGRRPIDIYDPRNKYKPYIGYQTNIIIDGHNERYKLFTYNLPSMYDRDYYIYLPYEYDPIAKVVYAFSV